ncbi:MAG: GNAT family N-acetyltransferase [Anaerolineales bacterium]|nr:GNAT family N-acetyltransferase [Anaerolineae bacterium]PWB56654.1 MAG: GNAT family N-acetyltransferase [Anaerolineales bacterium]
MQIEPTTLIGKSVRLEPLSLKHIPSLAKVGLEPKIWRYMRYGKVETVEQLTEWVQDILKEQAQGTDLPFTVIYQASGAAVGCTRYLHIEIEDRSLEIGGTWYGLDYQGTLVNTECKYLLLRHAFEELGCIRVWLKTDLRNLRSQRAIEKLGAVKEGVLRNHMILPDGHIRDSVIYSLIPQEWPAVRLKLEARLAAGK